MKSFTKLLTILALGGAVGAVAYYISERPVETKAPVQKSVQTASVDKPEQKFPDFASCPGLRDLTAYGDKNEDYAFLVAGKDGWVFRTKQDTRTEFEIDKQNMQLWQKLTTLLKSKGTDLVIAYTPTRAMVAKDFLPENDPTLADFDPVAATERYTNLLADMNAEGVLMVGTPAPEDAAHYFNKNDQHWTQSGAQQMAKAVAAYVQKLPVWPEINKTEFKTEKTGDIAFEGSFNKALEKMCGFKVPDEQDITTQTTGASGGSEEDQLFGDASVPQIVLVGTSNSKKESNDPNFEGHLKTALGADVYNAAVTGGGLDDSIVAYLASDEYKNHPPKVIIWEIPGYYDLSGDAAERTLRQVIPGIYGSCDNPLATLEAPVKLTEGKTDLLHDLGTKNLPVNGAYVALEFDEPVKKNFSMFIKGPGSSKSESYKFKRPRSNSGNTFYYAPRGKTATNFDTVTISVPEKMLGMTVTQAQICPIL